MTFDCTSMITLWRLDFTSPLYAGKYQTRTRRVMVQQEEYTRLQCNARYSVLVINYFYLQNYKCMKYKRCLLRYSGTRVHTSFYSMKGQRAFLLSPGWYASSLQDKEWECFFFLQQLNHQHQWSTSLTFHSSWSISERQKTSFMLSRYNFFTTCNYGFVLVPLSTDFNWKIYRGVKFLKV